MTGGRGRAERGEARAEDRITETGELAGEEWSDGGVGNAAILDPIDEDASPGNPCREGGEGGISVSLIEARIGIDDPPGILVGPSGEQAADRRQRQPRLEEQPLGEVLRFGRSDIDEGVEGRRADVGGKARVTGRVRESVDAARIAEEGVEPGGRVEQGPATRVVVGHLHNGGAEVGPAGRVVDLVPAPPAGVEAGEAVFEARRALFRRCGEEAGACGLSVAAGHPPGDGAAQGGPVRLLRSGHASRPPNADHAVGVGDECGEQADPEHRAEIVVIAPQRPWSRVGGVDREHGNVL